jgi:hypothetical protein
MRKSKLAILCGIIMLYAASTFADSLNTSDSYVRQPIKWQTITGACLFGTSWGIALVASLAMANADHCSDCNKVAPVLWIPFAGPLIAEFVDDTPGASPAFALNLIWSLSEALGGYFLISGMIGRKTRVEMEEKVSLLPAIFPNHGYGLKLQYNFKSL